MDAQLLQQGLVAQEGRSVDATIVPVPIQRVTRKERETIKRGETPEEWKQNPAIARQRDTDAANSSIVKRQMYDGDKLSALSVFSADTAFDSRLCHSAWPTDNRDYIFTTDEISPTAKVFPLKGTDNAFLQATNLKVWKTSDIDSMATTSLKGNYYVLNAEEAGVINHSTYDTARAPNSIHQLFIRDGYAYIAHYTQGFRVLDVGDPENLVEVAYYNVYDSLASDHYASDTLWAQGIYGFHTDPLRPKLCYAGADARSVRVQALSRDHGRYDILDQAR